MKIRTGFVSNSSSSSFVVLAAFPKGFVATEANVEKYLNQGPEGKTGLPPIRINEDAMSLILEILHEPPINAAGSEKLFTTEMDIFIFGVTSGHDEYYNPFEIEADDDAEVDYNKDRPHIFQRVPSSFNSFYN
jgi:hypothetical protein